MQSFSLSKEEYQQALAMLENTGAPLSDKIDMLVEIAMGLQSKPKNAQQLLDAIALYDRALVLCPDSDSLTKARILARRATAFYMMPAQDCQYLETAKEDLEQVIQQFESFGASAEEIAEAQLNLGLLIQSLAGFHRAKITDAISLYQKSLRVFTKINFPAEYVILHNNLATAYLSIPLTDEKAKMREALAVQSFEAALEIVTIEDMPSEYAMLQNNLGNALQYASSSHAVENNLRALTAYNEALKVRDRRNSPVAYANTVANKANCLRNLPDDLEQPERGNAKRLAEALKLYREARTIFGQYGEESKVEMVTQVIEEIESNLD